MVIMIIEDTAPVQAEEPIKSTNAEDSSVQALPERTLAVKYVLEIVTQEAITVPTPKALVVPSEMRQLLIKLAPVLLRGTSAPPSISKSTTVSIMEIESGSASMVLSPAIDIRKN